MMQDSMNPMFSGSGSSGPKSPVSDGKGNKLKCSEVVEMQDRHGEECAWGGNGRFLLVCYGQSGCDDFLLVCYGQTGL